MRKCDAFGPICPQKPRPLLDETGHEIVRVPNYPYPPQMDEDCLYLNVYTPAETGDERLPVLLYIHGGGLQEHFGSDYEYCGDSFCRHGVVVVTINYRLNVFGYYVHPALTGESGHRAFTYIVQESDPLHRCRWRMPGIKNGSLRCRLR